MKSILILSFCFLSTIGFAQTEKELKAQVSTIPKGTKLIILTLDSTKSQKELMANLVSHIIEKGYEVDNLNSELGMIQTKEKNVKFSWGKRFTFLLQNHKLRIRG